MNLRYDVLKIRYHNFLDADASWPIFVDICKDIAKETKRDYLDVMEMVLEVRKDQSEYKFKEN